MVRAVPVLDKHVAPVGAVVLLIAAIVVNQPVEMHVASVSQAVIAEQTASAHKAIARVSKLVIWCI